MDKVNATFERLNATIPAIAFTLTIDFLQCFSKKFI